MTLTDAEPDESSGQPATATAATEPAATGLEEAERARQIALRRLAHGPRTRAQLRRALLEREVPADVADDVLDRYETVGLLDDAAFAEQWVRERRATHGVSRRALAVELRRKGVPDDIAAEALEPLAETDDRAAAERLVARKLPGTRGLAQQRRAGRLVALLARKGYDIELAGEVVRAALASESDEAEPEGVEPEEASW